jgi:hypothetical protein
MKKMIVTVLILAISSLGFMACENRASDETRMTDSANQMSNAELERRIKSRLDADDQLRAANLKVNADEDKKVATLSGMVESEALRNTLSISPDTRSRSCGFKTRSRSRRRKYPETTTLEQMRKRNGQEAIRGRSVTGWAMPDSRKIVAKPIAN